MSTSRSVSVGRVEHQSKLEVSQVAMVEKLGSDIIRKTGEIGGLYLQLCLYIRQQKMSPKLVSVTLSKQGFKRSRVSEINRVAGASDKTFKDFEAKLIGFDKALELSRVEDGKPVATPAAGLLVSGDAITQDEADEIIEEENTPGSGKGSGKTVSVSMRIKGHVMAACKLGVRKEYCFVFGRYRVVMTRTEPSSPTIGNEA